MAYFNNNDSFYSGFMTPEEFGLFPSLQPQTLATTEEVYSQGTPTFSGSWSTVDQPGYSTVVSASLLAAPCYGAHLFGRSNDLYLTRVSLEPASFAFDSYPTPPHGSCWPTINQSPDPDHSSISNWDNVFASDQELETSVPIQTYNPGKHHVELWRIEARIFTDCKQSRQIRGAPNNMGSQPMGPS